jgi:hypothetical protein
VHTHETPGTTAAGEERTVWVDADPLPLRSGDVPVDLDQVNALFGQLSSSAIEA